MINKNINSNRLCINVVITKSIICIILILLALCKKKKQN